MTGPRSGRSRRVPLAAFAALAVIAIVGAAIWVGHAPPTDATRLPRFYGGAKVLDSTQARDQAEVEYVVKRAYREGLPASQLFIPAGKEPLLLHPYLEIEPGDVIADIGCGTGIQVVEFIEQGVPFDKLYAVEVNRQSYDALQFLLETYSMPGTERVELVFNSEGEDQTFGIPRGTVDVILLREVHLHVLDYTDRWPAADESLEPPQVTILRTMRNLLKPDGRLHVFELVFDDVNPAFTGEALPVERVTAEYERAGFRTLSSELLPRAGKKPYCHIVLGR